MYIYGLRSNDVFNINEIIHQLPCALHSCILSHSSRHSWLTLWMVGKREQADAWSTNPRTKHSDPVRVSPKEPNVFTDPPQSLDLVQQSIIPFSSLVASAKESCNTNKKIRNITYNSDKCWYRYLKNQQHWQSMYRVFYNFVTCIGMNFVAGQHELIDRHSEIMIYVTQLLVKYKYVWPHLICTLWEINDMSPWVNTHHWMYWVVLMKILEIYKKSIDRGWKKVPVGFTIILKLFYRMWHYISNQNSLSTYLLCIVRA